MKLIDYCIMSQKTLKKILRKKYEMENRDGFLYKKGTVPILLVAHLDTVHAELPKNIIDKGGKLSSPQGIGGDDRCGVYMIQEILKRHDCHVLFTEDEECGGIGAGKFCKSNIAKELKVTFAIELDRAGSNDAVFYDCANDEFTEFVLQDEHWVMGVGSYTDICDIAPRLNCAAVNLSCGYYNAHTKNEYVDIKEMETNIQKTCDLIERWQKGGGTHYEYVEDMWERGYYGYPDEYFDREYLVIYRNSSGTETIDTVIGTSLESAVGRFLINNPDLTFNHIIEMYDETFEEEFL